VPPGPLRPGVVGAPRRGFSRFSRPPWCCRYRRSPTLEMLRSLAGRALYPTPISSSDRRQACRPLDSWVERDRASMSELAHGRPATHGSGREQTDKWIELTRLTHTALSGYLERERDSSRNADASLESGVSRVSRRAHEPARSSALATLIDGSRTPSLRSVPIEVSTARATALDLDRNARRCSTPRSRGAASRHVDLERTGEAVLVGVDRCRVGGSITPRESNRARSSRHCSIASRRRQCNFSPRSRDDLPRAPDIPHRDRRRVRHPRTIATLTTMCAL